MLRTFIARGRQLKLCACLSLKFAQLSVTPLTITRLMRPVKVYKVHLTSAVEIAFFFYDLTHLMLSGGHFSHRVKQTEQIEQRIFFYFLPSASLHSLGTFIFFTVEHVSANFLATVVCLLALIFGQIHAICVCMSECVSLSHDDHDE